MNNELLQDTCEVSAADKVLLDNIHEMLDQGFDVLVQRNPDSEHLTVRHYIDPDSIYEHLVRDLIYQSNKNNVNDFIVNINDQSYCIQPLDKFREQLSDIESSLQDVVTKIENLEDRFKEI